MASEGFVMVWYFGINEEISLFRGLFGWNELKNLFHLHRKTQISGNNWTQKKLKQEHFFCTQMHSNMHFNSLITHKSID